MARTSAARAGLIALLVHVGVGIPIYFWAGLSTYFMNDLPTADDNLSYLRWGIVAALLSATVLVLVSVRIPGLSWRAVAFAVGTSAALNGAWLAFVFGSDVDNLGDDPSARSDAMSYSAVESIAVWCAVAALLGLVVAVWSQATRSAKPDGEALTV